MPDDPFAIIPQFLGIEGPIAGEEGHTLRLEDCSMRDVAELLDRAVSPEEGSTTPANATIVRDSGA
jgi:hypothetical protein